MAVPEHFFDESWRKGNFLLPTDEVARKELWKQLDNSTRCGAVHLPSSENMKTELRARIKAIEAYEAAGGGR